jgi:hypothetical protein
MAVEDYPRHYVEAHELEVERFAYCRSCGRPIPSRYLATVVDGMHPGCHRKATGRPAR